MIKSETLSKWSKFEKRKGSCSVKATVHLADLASQDAITAAASPWGNATSLVVLEEMIKYEIKAHPKQSFPEISL